MNLEYLEISVDEIEPFVRMAFQDDKELLTTFHDEPDFELLVKNNIANIRQINAKCYGIVIEGTRIGFSVFSDYVLYSFGINIHCRTKDIVLEWLKWVRDSLGKNYMVCLRKQNTRAVDFFIRNGMEKFSTDENNVYLINSMPCQDQVQAGAREAVEI